MKREILFLALSLIMFANLSFAYDFVGGKEAKQMIEELKLKLKDHPQEPKLLRDIGILYHNLGVEGDKKAVKEAFNYLERSYQLDSKDPLSLGYLGSTETLKARDALSGTYLGLGMVFKREEDILRARELWKKVIEVNPDSRDAEEAERMLELSAE